MPHEVAVPDSLLRELWADPGHAAETFATFAVRRLGPAAALEAETAAPPAADSEIVEGSVRLATTYGAIAGTPLFVALIPAYLAMLWEEARMVLRLAAKHGHEPTGTRAAAELLMLRGVHPGLAQAEAALESRLAGERRQQSRLRALIDLVRALLVLAGFIEAKELKQSAGRIKTVLMAVAGAVIWAITWIFPFTFLVALSWSARVSTEKLGWRAVDLYAPGTRAEGTALPRRTWVGVGASLMACVLPAAILFAAAKWHPAGLGIGHALAALAGLTLVVVLFRRATSPARPELLGRDT